jgi:hypothetical protein
MSVAQDGSRAIGPPYLRVVSIDRIAFDPLARAGLQDIELARISQEVLERVYNPPSVGETRTTTCAGSMKPCGPRQRSPWASRIAFERLATC